MRDTPADHRVDDDSPATANSDCGSTVTRPYRTMRCKCGRVSRTSATLDGPGDPHFVASLYTARTSYSFTTSAFIDALTQYDPSTKQMSANVRLNVIHHPLSDLFIVYNDQRYVTAEAPRPGRSLTIKVTQMVAF